MKSVLLVNAPYKELYGSGNMAVSYYFPLGLGYIASFLEKHGYKPVILTESQQNNVYQQLEELLTTNKYLMVGISSMTSAFPAALKIAAIVRRIAPGTPVVLGGAHASGVGEQVLDQHNEFDFLCIGEGEETTLELVETIDKGNADVGGINGLVWRKNGSKVVSNLPRDFHQPLDDFPFPARHLVDFKEFSIHAHVSTGKGIGATMLTSRGCPYNCIFCSAHLTDGKQYRFHSEDYIIAELKEMKAKYNVGYVFFEDDTLTVVRKRVRTLCKRLIKEKLDLEFGCFSRVDVFDEETAGLLSEAGFKMVIFGIESGVPRILEKIGKRTDLSSAKEAIRLCKKYRIKSYASFVVGFPFETRQDIKETLFFGKSLNASVLTFNPFVPFPGTPLFQSQYHTPSHPQDWKRFLTTEVPPFDMTPGVSAVELKRMVDKAHLEYYINPLRLIGILREIHSFKEFKTLFSAFWGMLSRVQVRRR